MSFTIRYSDEGDYIQHVINQAILPNGETIHSQDAVTQNQILDVIDAVSKDRQFQLLYAAWESTRDVEEYYSGDASRGKIRQSHNDIDDVLRALIKSKAEEIDF